MELSNRIHRAVTEPQLEPDPLLEAVRLCGPTHEAIAKRLGVSSVAVCRWSTGQRPLPPSRRKAVEALAREVFLSALEETRALFNARPELYRTASAKRWRDRLARAAELLRQEGIALP